MEGGGRGEKSLASVLISRKESKLKKERKKYTIY
jgi:hypothetical protein